MALRSGGHGYGDLTKLLHWATVLVLLVQLAVGYLLAVDDGGERRGRGRGRWCGCACCWRRWSSCR